MELVLFTVALSCFIISLLAVLIFGRDKKGIKAIQSTPPIDLNPLEVAYIYKKKVSTTDVLNLIPYLEKRGYLNVAKSQTSINEDDNNYVIYKLKEYDGNNSVEKYLFDNLFVTRNDISFDDIAINGNFVIGLNIAVEAVNSKHDKIFNAKSKKVKTTIKFINLVGMVILDLLYVFSGMSNNITVIIDPTILVVPLVIFMFQALGLFIITSGNNDEVDFGDDTKSSKGKNRLKNNLMGGGFILLLISFGICAIAFKTILKAAIYLFGIIVIAISELIRNYIDKKTDYGVKKYHEIENFSNYLEDIKAKKSPENLNYLNDNISYFYAVGIPIQAISNYNQYLCKLDGLITNYRLRGISKNNTDDTTINDVNTNVTNDNTILDIQEEKYNNMLDGKLTVLNEIAVPIKVPRRNTLNIFNMIKWFISS